MRALSGWALRVWLWDWLIMLLIIVSHQSKCLSSWKLARTRHLKVMIFTTATSNPQNCKVIWCVSRIERAIASGPWSTTNNSRHAEWLQWLMKMLWSKSNRWHLIRVRRIGRRMSRILISLRHLWRWMRNTPSAKQPTSIMSKIYKIRATLKSFTRSRDVSRVWLILRVSRCSQISWWVLHTLYSSDTFSSASPSVPTSSWRQSK